MSVQHIMPSILIDRRNIDQMRDQIIAEMKAATIVGIDTETHDENAHENLKKFRGSDTASAFDWRRIELTGLSIWADEAPYSYYFNIGQKDAENRLTFEEIKPILDAKRPDASWIAHNAPFEITVMRANFEYELENIICTMQMAVSAFGPDEYDHEEYISHQLGALKNLYPEASKQFANYDKSKGRDSLNFPQQKLLNKVLSKQSKSPDCYQGMVKEISYGYGLKKLVKKFFDYDMETYENVLKKNEAETMRDLTGEQVADYGADDAYWAVRLFYKLYEKMQSHCPNAIPSFFKQENPMIHIFSDIRREGIKINLKAVEKRKSNERVSFVEAIRELKDATRELFHDLPAELNEKLLKYEPWYAKKGQEYRDRLRAWAELPDHDDPLEMAKQVSSSVTTEWLGKEPKVKPLNLTHYFQTRLFLYDLAGVPVIVKKGKVQSDADTRGEVLEDLKNSLKEAQEAMEASPEKAPEISLEIFRLKKAIRAVELLGKLAGVEQRMKLYLAPYSLLTDPETGRIYPNVTSMLATRRMAGSNPNSMQLAKRGESTYVRGFLEPDDDHVFVAPDWSQIELVEIGEFSGDPEFAKAFGQLPYEDLHLGAAADVLSVVDDRITEEMLKGLTKIPEDQIPPFLLLKPNGEKLTPKDAKKFWRTVVGKGANFNYWYSGALATIGDKLGWDSSTMWAATDKYRTRFSVAEDWRMSLIQEAMMTGFVELPDGHRRYKWEATYEWANVTQRLFDMAGDEGISKFGALVIKGMQSRAKNQIVNAMIQGTCATLAKRSILAIKQRIITDGFRASFKSPIHDELLYSVHRDEVVPFIKMLKEEMTNHPEIIKNLKINCSVGMGLTFEPWDSDKAPFGLMEIDEMPRLDFIPEEYHDGSIPLDLVPQVVDYLFERRAQHG